MQNKATTGAFNMDWEARSVECRISIWERNGWNFSHALGNRKYVMKNRPENEWAGLVTRTGKQELCDTQFLFENASEILEVCQVVE